MSMVMSVSKGKIRQVRIGNKARMAVSTNSLGWEVQQYMGNRQGWTSCTPTTQTEGTARQLMDELEREFPQFEFRVYESLLFPPQ